MFRRARHQKGSLQRVRRKSGENVWVFRWYEIQPDGMKKYRKAVVGTVSEFKSEAEAQKAVDALRLTINEQTPGSSCRSPVWPLSFSTTVSTRCPTSSTSKRSCRRKYPKTKTASRMPRRSPTKAI